VAQISGVGLITSHLTGVQFELGIFLGLGGMLVCSFLGGMRAVTWTQVAQYVILIVAYLVPVVWLSVKQTGIPVPQLVYGYQLEKVTALEQALQSDPGEIAVRDVFQQRSRELAAKLEDPATALAAERVAAKVRLDRLKIDGGTGSAADVAAAEKALIALPPGALASYGHLASALGRPGAARVVGRAVGHNPVAVLIPCHRVIRETGGLGGYRWGLPRKQALLSWEAVRAL